MGNGFWCTASHRSCSIFTRYPFALFFTYLEHTAPRGTTQNPIQLCIQLKVKITWWYLLLLFMAGHSFSWRSNLWLKYCQSDKGCHHLVQHPFRWIAGEDPHNKTFGNLGKRRTGDTEQLLIRGGWWYLCPGSWRPSLDSNSALREEFLVPCSPGSSPTGQFFFVLCLSWPHLQWPLSSTSSLGLRGLCSFSSVSTLWGAWHLFSSHGLFYSRPRVSLATQFLQKCRKHCCVCFQADPLATWKISKA